MVKSLSQNFVKYHGCGVYFMDGTSLLDGKHRSVHHKKCFLSVTQPFWKRPEDVINNVETRSQLHIANLTNIQTMNLHTVNQVDALKQH